ncbi:MAG: hypothetical protein LBT64_03630 [Puniceicoccales bacterium]|jgi:hypothetical protein|nr:hypothetical protein [Puniceicoccales bacterium]
MFSKTASAVSTKMLRGNFLLPLVICAAICGCSSAARNHQERLERIYTTCDRISEISDELQDIEQMMLCVGRIRDSPLADDALDVALAIHGEPDELEKARAKNISADEIRSIKMHAMDLVKQKSALEFAASRERRRVMGEARAMEALEIRHRFFEKLVSNCAIGFGVITAIFIFRRFF